MARSGRHPRASRRGTGPTGPPGAGSGIAGARAPRPGRRSRATAAAQDQPATYRRPALRVVPDGTARRRQPFPGPSAGACPQTSVSVAVGPPAVQTQRRPAGRGRFVVVRDPKERELRVARRRARAKLPSPVAVTRDIALALLEVEAGCRSAAQLERVVSPELWEILEQCIGRRGGPLPSGRSVIVGPLPGGHTWSGGHRGGGMQGRPRPPDRPPSGRQRRPVGRDRAAVVA